MKFPYIKLDLLLNSHQGKVNQPGKAGLKPQQKETNSKAYDVSSCCRF
jgi:hypothetical protein